jgi:hypothetical protein
MISNVLSLLAGTEWIFTSCLSTVSGCPTSRSDLLRSTTTSGVDVETLAPQLSANAKIYLPRKKEFAFYTARWSNLEAPTPNIVVAPVTKKDVLKIVSASTDASI